MCVTQLPPTPGSSGASFVVRRTMETRDSSTEAAAATTRRIVVACPEPCSGKPVITWIWPSRAIRSLSVVGPAAPMCMTSIATPRP